MEVQIFGTKKCKDTQKALRFFKERRVKVHFVDLNERAASVGELRRFEQKFGAEALLDRDGKRFRDRGQEYSRPASPWPSTPTWPRSCDGIHARG